MVHYEPVLPYPGKLWFPAGARPDHANYSNGSALIMNRREFVQSSAAAIAAAKTAGSASAEALPKRPVVISSRNGIRATAKAMEILKQGGDTLDAVIAGVNIVELDPEDRTVGYGGIPNEEGKVQLDASVMHGPTNGAGAVSCLEGIKTPSLVAKLVMEKTDHVLLTGAGALKFALSMGFKYENLLTDSSRETWMRWKRNLNTDDNWIDPQDRIPAALIANSSRDIREAVEMHGTINCNAVNEKGEISGVTTTSGLPFKIPGRVGDSPIIGAGLYVDNEVGACGSTGRGEANLKTCASFMAVEFMRQGLSPEEAGLRVMQRIIENTTEPYLLDKEGKPKYNLNFYALNKKGEYAGVCLFKGGTYSVHDGMENRVAESAYLLTKGD